MGKCPFFRRTVTDGFSADGCSRLLEELAPRTQRVFVRGVVLQVIGRIRPAQLVLWVICARLMQTVKPLQGVVYPLPVDLCSQALSTGKSERDSD